MPMRYGLPLLLCLLISQAAVADITVLSEPVTLVDGVYNYYYTVLNPWDGTDDVVSFRLDGVGPTVWEDRPGGWNAATFGAGWVEWTATTPLIPGNHAPGFILRSSYGPADLAWSLETDEGRTVMGSVQGPQFAPGVPEPASLCLLGLAGAGGLAMRRRRRGADKRA